MSESVEREYDIEDLLMLERAQVFHDNFVDDKAAFTADFPHLADPFAGDFQAAIDAADAIPLSSTVEAQIAVVTEQLNDQMPLGRKALQKLYTYVELVWNSKARDNEFGRNKYEKARSSQVKMKELLELANAAAEVPANKTELLAAGYTQAAIDELLTIMTAIDTLNAQQEKLLSGRGVKTETRIKAYNAVWDFMKQINKASKVTFEDSPAKIEQYLLYPTSHTSLPKVQNLAAVLDGGPPLNAMLSWNVSEGATDYEIQRSAVALGQPAGSFIPLVTVQNTQYSDIVSANQSYYYRVRAINASLTGAWSDVAQLDT